MSDLIAGLKSFETQMLDLIAAEYATKNPDLGNTNDDRMTNVEIPNDEGMTNA